MPIIQGKADPSAVFYADGFIAYDGLVNYGYKKHYRIKHGENKFSDGHTTSTALKTFGDSVKSDWRSFVERTNTRFTCMSKNVDLDTIAETKIYT